jgi:hypothetical protein
MEMERVSQPVEGWFGFIRGNFVELFKGLLRVNLYALAAVVLAVLAIAAGVAVLIFTSWGMVGWALLAIGILVAIILVVIARLFTLALYKVVEEQHGAKQKVDIIGVAKEKAVPAIIYGLIVAVIYAVVLIPFGLVGLGVTVVTGIVVIGPFVQLGLVLVSVLVGFFLQFTLFELVLEDKGPLESMRASFGLAKRNFWETIVLYIIRAVLGWFVSLPFIILLVIAIFAVVIISIIGGVTAAMVGGGSLLAIGGIALLVLFMVPFLLAYRTTGDTVLLPLSYRYWRTIRGDMKLEKKPAAASTGAPAKAAAAPAKGMPPSQSRAIMATPESGQVMVAPVAGAMAAMPSQKPAAAQPTAKPAAKKAAPKKPAPKRAAKSR